MEHCLFIVDLSNFHITTANNLTWKIEGWLRVLSHVISSSCFCWKGSLSHRISLNRDQRHHYWPFNNRLSGIFVALRIVNRWYKASDLFWATLMFGMSHLRCVFCNIFHPITNNWYVWNLTNLHWCGVTDNCLNIWSTNKLARFVK